MKAIQYVSFGKSDVLQLTQTDKPEFKENEVLVKIAATTVNPFDIKVRTGSIQKAMPVQLPYTPGTDVSGVIEAVGEKVTRVKAGDEIFATTYGKTYTEYIAIKEDQAALRPKNISANEAAALAVPITTAYSVLIETAGLQAGQRVLIHGASGGVGSVMVQMAKALGAYVIGTASGGGIKLVTELGADEVIDYKNQDFTQLAKNVDLVVDTVGGETQTRSFEVLNKGGKLVSIFMPPSAELAKKYEVSAQFISSAPSYKKLDFGRELVEQGRIKPQVAKVMKLEQAAEAQDLVTAGGLNGKVVLEIN